MNPRELTIAIAIFFLFTIVYATAIDIRATYSASITADEPFYLMTTKSLISDGDLDLRNQYASEDYREFFDHDDGLWTQSVPLEDGRLLSPHNTALPIYLVPGFILGGLLGTQIQMVLTASFTWSLAFLLSARVSKSLLVGAVGTLVVGLSSTAIIYGSEIYPEMPAALVILICLLYTRERQVRSFLGVMPLVVLISLLPWLGTKYAILGVVLACYALSRLQRRQQYQLVSMLLLSGIYYVWFHLTTFDGLTPYNVNKVYYNNSTIRIFGFHINVVDRFYRLWGLFLDRRFGMLHWQPIIALAVPGLFMLRNWGQEGRAIALLVLAQWLVACFVAITMMGYWFPGRTIVTIFPLLPVAVAILCTKYSTNRFFWFAGALLSVYGFLISVFLIWAGRGGVTGVREIVVAYNPYELSNPLFQTVGKVLPQYTEWTAETWSLTIAWLLLVLLICVYLARDTIRRDYLLAWRFRRHS